MTSIEKWSSKKPYVGHLRMFGCVSWVDISDEYKKKLDPKSHACTMMGYFEEPKVYRLFDPVKLYIIIHRNEIFDENTFGLDLLNSPSTIHRTVIPLELLKIPYRLFLPWVLRLVCPLLFQSQSTLIKIVTSPDHSSKRNNVSPTPYRPR